MHVARFISRHAKAILVAALILAIPAAIGFIKTGINYDILSYLPQHLNSMQGEIILDKEYGDASTGILIIDGKSTYEILDLKEKIAKVPGVQAVVWVDNLVDPTVPAKMLPEELRTGFFSGTTTRLIIKFAEGSTSITTHKAIDGIRKLGDERCFLSGASPIIKDTKDLADKETPLYVLLAVIFSVIILSLTMESPLIPFVFLAEIGLAILYNFGSNIVLGQISYVTQALAAVLQLGVTMDFSIFLLHRYEEERPKFQDRREAMAEAIEKTFLTISGGALTEVAGFLALCVMDLALGTDIGVVMAKGVVIGLVGTMTVLPAMLLILDKPIHKFNHRPFLPTFEKTARFVSKHYVALSVVFVLLFVPAIYGRSKTQQYYNLIDSLPKDMPSVQATNRLKTDFNMTTTHFLIVRDDLPAADIRELIDRVQATKGITTVLAYEKFAGPLLPASLMPDEVKSIFKTKGHNLIIVNSEYSASTDAENAQIDEINAIVRSYDKDAYITGEGVLTKDLIAIAATDFKRVDIVSIGAVFLIILAIFTSLTVPVVLVGGIELAIFINMAIPYFTGEAIPFIASIVIGCIQLGVTIDYAILLVTRFKEELRKGADRKEAMRIALQSSAISIVTSALTLFGATAGVGFVSKIAILKCLCGMIAKGALISMVIILFILPSVLILCEGLIEKTSLNWKKPLNLRRPSARKAD
jgi:predicted RND superfamily exporter protein